MSDRIHYVKVGGSYQLVNDYTVTISLKPAVPATYERITLDTDGKLCIKSGYCWDGTSGPVIDRQSNMRAGCVHDSLYHLMRMQLLPHSYWKEADSVFHQILLEDGAWKSVAHMDMLGLRIARGSAAHPKNRRKVHTAFNR